MTQRKKFFEYTVRKGENAEKPAFSLFPTLFLTHPRSHFSFLITFILSYANAFNLDKSKILLFRKELNNGGSAVNFFTPFFNISFMSKDLMWS